MAVVSVAVLAKTMVRGAPFRKILLLAVKPSPLTTSVMLALQYSCFNHT
jgi:hypothetical protein